MSHVYIIAEAGVNHNGSRELALKLIDAAADAGVDAVKFQTFQADTLVSPDAPKAVYQKANCGTNETQYQMLKRLELSEADHEALRAHCAERDIEFLSTPFDVSDIDYLRGFGISRLKIPSGSVTDYPYLRKINGCGLPVILSTGMSTLDEVAAALDVLKDCKVSLLHCTTEYPCPFEAVNLRAMQTMRERFGLPVGYSDHTPGITIPVAAVAMGAEIIEKHFTLDRTMEGPDHKASVEPDELKAMVRAIRNVEQSLGNGVKEPAEAERKNMAIARKSIIAKCAIRKGECFTEENLAVKRPGTGLSPMRWPELVGKVCERDYEEGEVVGL